jgi:uncharacterized protein
MPRTSTAQIDASRKQRGDPALLEALAAPAMYPRHPQVAVQETHASWVFLAGEHAYKVKKPIALGFLDYSTLSLRHAACREEVRVNRDLAPGIYLGVRAIVRVPVGFRFARQDTPGAVEYAVQMRRFDEADTLEGVIAAGALSHANVREIARRLERFHRHACPVSGGSPGEVLDGWRKNVAEIEEHAPPERWDMKLMAGFGEACVRARTPEIERRASEGHVRDGHGDLRCEHVLLGRTIRIVDRIEFDPALRRTDIASDLAFLTMDLEAHRQRWAARELISAYRNAGGNPGSEALRSFYAAHRALVRAKVALVAAEQARGAKARLRVAEPLWALAERLCWRARAPLMIVVCGPPASGKSTLAGELHRRTLIPVASSDVVRKRLAEIELTDRGGPEHYTPEFTRGTYELLSRDALACLHRFGAVIVDATCHSREERVLLLGGTPIPSLTRLVVECRVPLDVALRRAELRMQSPGRVSDATPVIVAEQFRTFEPLDELPAEQVLVLDTQQPVSLQVAVLARAVDRELLRTSRSRIEG